MFLTCKLFVTPQQDYVGTSLLIGQVNLRLHHHQEWESCDLPDKYKVALCHHGYKKTAVASERNNDTWYHRDSTDSGPILLHKDRYRQRVKGMP